MSADRIRLLLESIAGDPDFNSSSALLVDEWTAANVELEVVEPVLRFMEMHPQIDYGMPGALVHLVERFHRLGYEQLLLDSVARRPTTHTTWMLNRLLNGTRDATTRRSYLRAMEDASRHPMADPETREQIRRFLGAGG